MKSLWILPFVLVLTSTPAALAQRGRGMGAPHGTATSPGMSTPAASGPSRTARSGDTTASGRIASNPALASRIQPLLPAGMTAQSAASGFKNQGQFLAALHASHNLNIPFDQLKAKMTGSNPASLGNAIHGLRPDLDKAAVKKQVKTAGKQSDRDLGS